MRSVDGGSPKKALSPTGAATRASSPDHVVREEGLADTPCETGVGSEAGMMAELGMKR